MFQRYFLVPAVCLAMEAFAQAPAKVDFARDVQPLLRQNCIGCHGPAQQMSGLRLDRKSSVLKIGMRRVVPGSSENSFLYHRVSGSAYGLQMPPTGPLKPEQIALLKAWIDQGAEWPDKLSNEAELPPVNPKAVAMVDALRRGDRQALLKSVAEDTKLLNARGPEGSTPFMYAVLYSDAAFLEDLLKKGADANAHNDVKATPLMWAAGSLEESRVLLAHGADVNAKSEEGRTALTIAAGRPGNSAVVRLLLDKGANPNPTKNPMAEPSPLVGAAVAADPVTMRVLIEHGANVEAGGAMAMAMAITQDCSKCVDLVANKDYPKEAYTFILLNVANLADAKTVRMLLDKGADVNAVDPLGRTALHNAAVSDLQPVDVVKVLLEHGADVNARSKYPHSRDSGMTALDIAKLHGDTPLVRLLQQAGATSAVQPEALPKPSGTADLRTAVQRALPLVQRADANFTAKSGCISCHNDSFAAMAVGLARGKGYRVDETISPQQVKVNAASLEHMRDAFHQGYFGAQAGAETVGNVFGPSVIAYMLLGLDAEHYKADLNTDAAAMYLKSQQSPDGQWRYPAVDTRQPICLDYVGQTALSMRALQLYAPKTDKAEYDRSIQLAAAWLAKAEPKTFEDRIWRVQGLGWAGKDKETAQKALHDLIAAQRQDGGWSAMPTMESDAFVTGHTLVALHTAGLPVTDPAYQRGVKYLLRNQTEDGSWHVRTRALALQPYFETGFPHGLDQSISAAGTSWATMALTLASGNGGGSTKSAAGPLE